MKANRKRIVPEGAGVPGKTIRPDWTLAQGAIHPGRRMLFPILAFGLIAGFSLMTPSSVSAQTFTTLYNFTASSINSRWYFTNSDGANPYAGLTGAGNRNTRYGTAANGGSGGA